MQFEEVGFNGETEIHPTTLEQPLLSGCNLPSTQREQVELESQM
jgi:hypothetical protein